MIIILLILSIVHKSFESDHNNHGDAKKQRLFNVDKLMTLIDSKIIKCQLNSNQKVFTMNNIVKKYVKY